MRSFKKEEQKLKNCLNWSSINHFAELLQAHLYQIKKGDKDVIVSDWDNNGAPIRLNLDPLLKPHEQVAKHFKRARKLKKGIPFAEKELQRIENYLSLNKQFLEKFDLEMTDEAYQTLKLDSLFPKRQEKGVKEDAPRVKPYHEHISASGIPIWVGKNASMNDRLTFQLASGNDLWMHAAGVSGSHVVVRSNNQEVDLPTFNQALGLALYHSKARLLKEGEIVVTQVKHVKRIGRQKGKVQIAHEKRYFIKC